MKKLFLFLTVLSGLTSISAKEPPRDGGLFPVQILNRYFAFDEAQSLEFEALLESRHAGIESIKGELRINRQAIGEIMTSEDPDATALGELMLYGKELNEQMRAVQVAFSDGFAAMLTEEQAQKYNALVRAQRLQPVIRAADAIKLPLIPPERPTED